MGWLAWQAIRFQIAPGWHKPALNAAAPCCTRAATQWPHPRHGAAPQSFARASVRLSTSRTAHHLAAEQVNDHGQVKLSLIGGGVRGVPGPDPVRPGCAEPAVGQVGRNRQRVAAVGGDLEAALALGTNAVPSARRSRGCCRPLCVCLGFAPWPS